LNIFNIGISIPGFLRDTILGVFANLNKVRGLSIVKALLATCNGSSLDGVDNSRALRRNFDIFLLSSEENPQRYEDGTKRLC
jgi:hypothetical protein